MPPIEIDTRGGSYLPSGDHRRRAVSLFSWSVEENARDTQMTTRVTEGARRERHDKRRLLFLFGLPPSFLASRDFVAQCSRARAPPFLNLKKKRDSSQSKASSTRIRKFLKTKIFFYEYGSRPYVSSVFSGRIRKFLKTLSRVEIFLSDTNTYTCGRSYPEIFEYAFVILLDPVFTASIINKHGVQQGCSFFVSCSDF